MKITIKCSSEQVVLMAIDEFEKSYNGWFRRMPSKVRIKKDGDFFVVGIEDRFFTECFLKFVQSRKFFKKYFKTEVSLDEVTGFVSSECVADAIEAFNGAYNDFYIESSVEIAEIQTDRGILYVPIFYNQGLERLFWEYVRRNGALRENVLTGEEVYQ